MPNVPQPSQTSPPPTGEQLLKHVNLWGTIHFPTRRVFPKWNIIVKYVYSQITFRVARVNPEKQAFCQRTSLSFPYMGRGDRPLSLREWSCSAFVKLSN